MQQSANSSCPIVVGLPAPAAAKAQLGLGHSYSRAKVKFNVHRADNMIIQSISLLDQVDKDINTFSMRIRCVCVRACVRVCVHKCMYWCECRQGRLGGHFIVKLRL